MIAAIWLPSATRLWDSTEPLAALLHIALALAVYAIALAIGWLVETRLTGRARLWARIAEVSAAVGVVVFGFALSSDGKTQLLAGAFWSFVTGALVLLMALRRDVTT